MSETCGNTRWDVECVNDIPEFAATSNDASEDQYAKIVLQPGMQILHPDTNAVLYTAPTGGGVKKSQIKIPAV